MADTPTTAFSGAASGTTTTTTTTNFTDLEKFRIQQDAKHKSCSHESAGRPFMGLGGK